MNAVDPVELACRVTRAETLAECHHLASLYEREEASAGAVRLVLGFHVSEAWAEVAELTPLDEAPPTGAGASSSGVESSCPPVRDDALPPSAPLPPTEDDYLRHIADVHDRLLKLLWPETTSRKAADTPRLRIVEGDG